MRSALLPWAPYAKTTRLDEHGIALPKLSLKRPVRTRTRSFDLKCAPRTTSGLMSRIARPGIAAAGVRPVAGAVAERMTAEPASPISADRSVRLATGGALMITGCREITKKPAPFRVTSRADALGSDRRRCPGIGATLRADRSPTSTRRCVLQRASAPGSRPDEGHRCTRLQARGGLRRRAPRRSARRRSMPREER